ncbi:MAG: methylated-DNA--[protein]-cysteine S-methyltransferase [Bauldia sp.]
MMMQSNLAPAAPAVPDPSSDYDTVRSAIEYISLNWEEQPSLDRIAAAAGMDPLAFHRLFQRWAGLTPKTFLQAVTLDRARRLVAESPSILDASLALGLSGPGRLHDLFVTHEAMTPGEFRKGGAGLTLRWGVHPSPFGMALVVLNDGKLAGLGFVEGNEGPEDFERRWPNAIFVRDDAATAAIVRRIFEPSEWRGDRPLRVVLIGTDFEIRVWETLLRIPCGAATTYSDVAEAIGRPSASRAVGAAVGKNPVSFVVPCHRVLGKSGALTGYHWGLTRKRAMLGWETGIASR